MILAITVTKFLNVYVHMEHQGVNECLVVEA